MTSRSSGSSCGCSRWCSRTGAPCRPTSTGRRGGTCIWSEDGTAFAYAHDERYAPVPVDELLEEVLAPLTCRRGLEPEDAERAYAGLHRILGERAR